MDQSTRRPSGPRAQHYQFAHRILPLIFFQNPAGYIANLTRFGDFYLEDFWNMIRKHLESPEDWVEVTGLHGEVRKAAGDISVALITLPEPLVVTEAYFTAQVYHPQFEGKLLARFFTLEFGYSMPGEPKSFTLGGWQDGTHFNYGHVTATRLDEFFALVMETLAGRGPTLRAKSTPPRGE